MKTTLTVLALSTLLVPSLARADGEQPAPAPPPRASDTPSLTVPSTNPYMRDYVAPQLVPYEGGDIPVGASLVKKTNWKLVGGGIGVLGASYAGSLIYALATCSAQQDCRGGSQWLYIPVIGPFITLGDPNTPTTGGRALAGFAGGVQVVGAALLIAGIVKPQTFVMWQNRRASLSVTPTYNVAPVPTGGSAMTAGIGFTIVNR